MSLGGLITWPYVAAFGGALMIVGIAIIAFWIWMIVDVAQRKFKEKTEKIIWILVFFNFLTRVMILFFST